MGRFINADAFASTNQGLLSNNMYTYCLNNPINNSDPTGESVLMTLLFAAAGAAVNVATTWIAATVTGQSYSFSDGCAAALSGALCSFGGVWVVAAGLVSGLYSGYMSYQNGAEWWGALIAGLVSGYLTMAGIGNLANLEHTLANLGVQAFVDLVFCTAYNTMSVAVYKSVTPGKNDNDAADAVDIVPQPEPSVPSPTAGSGGGWGSYTPSRQNAQFCLIAWG